MISLLVRSLSVFSILFFSVLTANADLLSGNIGASLQSDSAWINLSQITHFKKGDQVKIRVGGTAKKIVIRFLSKSTDPNSPAGVEGDVIEIPENRTIDIVLQEDHHEVKQISVHGGTNPWGLFFLGGGNGPVTIINARHLIQLQSGWKLD